MIYYSTENLKTETMDRKTRDRILSLSYEQFFNDAIKESDNISFLNKSIEDVTTNYIKTAKVLKQEFTTFSTEVDDANAGKTKTKFFANIKNWFIKVWIMIATIFEKIVSVIQSLIKSLILYIKKHLIIKNSLYTKLKEDDKSLSFTNPSKEMKNHLFKMLNGKMSINTIDLDGERLCNFDDLIGVLKNPQLMEFMKTKIIINNKNSTFNTENLENLFKTIEIIDGANEYTAEARLGQLSDSVTDFAATAVLYGETDGSGRLTSIYGEASNSDMAIIELLKNSNVKSAANAIVFNTTDVKRGSMSINEFMGLADKGISGVTDLNVNIALAKLRNNLSQYELIGNLVIGKGGYCEIMTEVLKRYSVAANNDKKHIQNLKNSITNLIQKIDNDIESGQKVTNRCKRFTNLVIRIEKIKNDFIMLRQFVLGDVLTCFSIMDRGLATVLIPSAKFDEESELIGGKNGKSILDEQDDLDAATQLEEEF